MSEARATRREGEDGRPALFDRAIAAFNERDMPALDRVVSDEIRAHVSPALANDGHWEGREAFYRMVSDWTDPFSELQMEVRRYELLDERLMVAHIHQHAVGAVSGAPVELDVCFAVETSPEPEMRMTRFEVHPDRESALASLGWTAPG